MTLGESLGGRATTTEAVRRAMQHSQERLRALSKRYGVRPKTIAKVEGPGLRCRSTDRSEEAQVFSLGQRHRDARLRDIHASDNAKKVMVKAGINVKPFKDDFGDALDAYEEADKKVDDLTGGGDKAKLAAAKEKRLKKAGEAAVIGEKYTNIIKAARILTDALQTERHSIMATGYREVYEDSFLQLSHTLTVEAGLKGSYGDFSGSVSSKFGSVEKRTEKRHLQKISFTVSGYSHSIKATRASLKTLLNEGFRGALATMTPGDLFREYGTHLINKIIMGGRAEFFCQTSDIYSMSKQEFQVIARSKYKAAGGKIEGNQSTDTTNSKKEHLVLGSVSVDIIGGSAKGAIMLKDGEWSKWAASCKTSPAFLGLDEDDGLVPIWELTDDPARRAAIQEAYQRTAALALRTYIVSETSGVASRPEVRVTVPKGYKLLSGGAQNNWTGKGSFLTASFPEVDAPEASPAWEVHGKDHLGDTDGVSTHHDHYFPEKTSVTAFAIAIYDPDDIWEVRTVYFDNPNAGREESPSQSLFTNRAQIGETPPKDFRPLTETGFVLVGGRSEGTLLWQRQPAHYDVSY
jgi:MAC/Perforin domain